MKAMELKVAIQTEDYEAAAGFLSKISEVVAAHGAVIRMSTSLEEIRVRDRQESVEFTAEAESHPIGDQAEDPFSQPEVLEEDG